MKRYLIDTNVVLDLLMERVPFVDAAETVFDAAYRGEIKLFLSALSYSNIYYIMRPKFGKKHTLEGLRLLMRTLFVLPVDANVIKEALASDFTDFEDAIQYYSAVRSGVVDGIITRNGKDFRLSEISIVNPTDFL